MLGLTERAPWGYAIMECAKGVENRSWYPPAHVLGQRIAIHQGKVVEDDALVWLRGEFGRPTYGQLKLGAILGTVLLKGFVYVRADGGFTASKLTTEEAQAAMHSRWRAPQSKCLWVLTDPRPLRTPVRCRGFQGLWTVPEDVLAAMQSQGAVLGEAQP